MFRLLKHISFVKKLCKGRCPDLFFDLSSLMDCSMPES